MAATLEELTAIEEIGPGTYRSKALPEHVGHNPGVAFGGCALGIATRAAHATVPASHALYSLVGHFLGPARTDAQLECVVHTTRNTKTFATRRVEVRQRQPDGRMRVCLEALADFHAREGAGGLTWSATPSRPYSAVSHQPAAGAFSVPGGVAPERVAAAAGLFALGDRHFETRYCREGVGAQNLHGLLKGQPTTQDALAAPARATAEYLRARSPALSTGAADQAAALAFLLDGGVAGCALTHADGGVPVDDVAALASLDFALRVTTPDVDLRRWHLRERSAPAAGHGRTYAEARLWSDDGTLVAVMSQQGFLRLKRPPPRL